MLQVALKMHKVVQDPRGILRTEAEMHVNAWVKLGHVISPLGYLKAHDQTGTPAMLVLELAMYVHRNSSMCQETKPFARQTYYSSSARENWEHYDYSSCLHNMCALVRYI